MSLAVVILCKYIEIATTCHVRLENAIKSVLFIAIKTVQKVKKCCTVLQIIL